MRSCAFHRVGADADGRRDSPQRCGIFLDLGEELCENGAERRVDIRRVSPTEQLEPALAGSVMVANRCASWSVIGNRYPPKSISKPHRQPPDLSECHPMRKLMSRQVEYWEGACG